MPTTSVDCGFTNYLQPSNPTLRSCLRQQQPVEVQTSVYGGLQWLPVILTHQFWHSCQQCSWGETVLQESVVATLQAAASPCARAIDYCSHAHAKSVHALWPIRAPTFRLRQSERDLPAAPIRTRELSSRLTRQRRILGLFGASR